MSTDQNYIERFRDALSLSKDDNKLSDLDLKFLYGVPPATETITFHENILGNIQFVKLEKTVFGRQVKPIHMKWLLSRTDYLSQNCLL